MSCRAIASSRARVRTAASWFWATLMLRVPVNTRTLGMAIVTRRMMIPITIRSSTRLKPLRRLCTEFSLGGGVVNGESCMVDGGWWMPPYPRSTIHDPPSTIHYSPPASLFGLSTVFFVAIEVIFLSKETAVGSGGEKETAILWRHADCRVHGRHINDRRSPG